MGLVVASKMNDLINQYTECLEKYFYLLGEISKLPNNEKIEKVQKQTLGELIIVGNSLKDYLRPSLKEK